MALPVPAKEFHYLAKGMSSVITAGAAIAVVALAWYAVKIYQRSKEVKVEAGTE